jgi:hypothetical protein
VNRLRLRLCERHRRDALVAGSWFPTMH